VENDDLKRTGMRNLICKGFRGSLLEELLEDHYKRIVDYLLVTYYKSILKDAEPKGCRT